MSLKTINKKVVSYCKIPQGITDRHYISEASCDSYIDYSLEDVGEDTISDWIRENYPELENEEFLIHINY